MTQSGRSASAFRVLPREDQLHHQPLRTVGLQGVLAMDELPAVLLQPGDGLRTSGVLRVGGERAAVEDDLLAVEWLAALAERHPGLPRVGPDAGELAGLGLEADQAH